MRIDKLEASKAILEAELKAIIKNQEKKVKEDEKITSSIRSTTKFSMPKSSKFKLPTRSRKPKKSRTIDLQERSQSVDSLNSNDNDKKRMVRSTMM